MKKVFALSVNPLSPKNEQNQFSFFVFSPTLVSFFTPTLRVCTDDGRSIVR